MYSPSHTTIHVLVTRSTENQIRRDLSQRWLRTVWADLREHDRGGVRFLSHWLATEAGTRCCLVSIIRNAETCGGRTKRGAPTAQPHRRGGRSSRPHPPSTTEKSADSATAPRTWVLYSGKRQTSPFLFFCNRARYAGSKVYFFEKPGPKMYMTNH